MRSSPIPVSTFCAGQRRQRPVRAAARTDMKTRFQNSRKRSQRGQAGAQLGSPQPCSGAPVPVDLRVGAARPRPADRPEVLRARQRDDPLGGHPDRLPVLDRGLVRPEPVAAGRRRARSPRRGPSRASAAPGRTRSRSAIAPSLKYCPNEKLPSISKKVRWWPSRPDLVDVLRPEALLRRRRQQRRRRLLAEEVRHLRLHARAVQQRRGVARARHERPRRQPLVPLRLEEGEEALAQLGARPHPGIVGARLRRALAAGRSAPTYTPASTSSASEDEPAPIGSLSIQAESTIATSGISTKLYAARDALHRRTTKR